MKTVLFPVNYASYTALVSWVVLVSYVQKNKALIIRALFKREVSSGFEPLYEVLQTSA